MHGLKEQCLVSMASMSLIKIAGRGLIFSPFGIEAKLIENLLHLGLKDDALHLNKRPEYA